MAFRLLLVISMQPLEVTLLLLFNVLTESFDPPLQELDSYICTNSGFPRILLEMSILITANYSEAPNLLSSVNSTMNGIDLDLAWLGERKPRICHSFERLILILERLPRMNFVGVVPIRMTVIRHPSFERSILH